MLPEVWVVLINTVPCQTDFCYTESCMFSVVGKTHTVTLVAGQNINPFNWGIFLSACCLASFRALSTCTVGMATVLLTTEKKKWKQPLVHCSKPPARPRIWPFSRQGQMYYKLQRKKKLIQAKIAVDFINVQVSK